MKKGIAATSYLLFFLLCLVHSSSAQAPQKMEELVMDKLDRVTKRGILPYNPLAHKRSYLISRSNQVVQLVETHQGLYKGQLMSYLWEKKPQSYKIIKEFLPIPAQDVRSLMEALEEMQFESLPDERRDLGILPGMDGEYFVFSSFSNQGINLAQYWSPLTIQFASKQSPEHDRIRDIIGLIDEVVHFRVAFKHLFHTLRPGTYHYGMVIWRIY